MEVWTCRQATWGYCNDSKFIHNTRHLTPEGIIATTKRQSCPFHHRQCPFFFYFDVSGQLIDPKENI